MRCTRNGVQSWCVEEFEGICGYAGGFFGVLATLVATLVATLKCSIVLSKTKLVRRAWGVATDTSVLENKTSKIAYDTYCLTNCVKARSKYIIGLYVF